MSGAAYAGPSFQDYGTPWYIVRAIERSERRGRFIKDVCAAPWNAKADDFITEEQDGFRTMWSHWNYCNPRYRLQAKWLRRAAFLAEQHHLATACLIKASIDARYWFRLVACRGAVDFYIGRIPFIAPPEGLTLKTKKGLRIIPGGAPVPGTSFASAVVFYGPGYTPGAVRYRDATTGELIDIERARELRAGAAA